MVRKRRNPQLDALVNRDIVLNFNEITNFNVVANIDILPNRAIRSEYGKNAGFWFQHRSRSHRQHRSYHRQNTFCDSFFFTISCLQVLRQVHQRL